MSDVGLSGIPEAGHAVEREILSAVAPDEREEVEEQSHVYARDFGMLITSIS